MTDETSSESTPKKRGRGRPRKSELAAHGKGSKNAVGRPKGDTAIINDYKQRMLASPKSKHVLQTVLNVAGDPEHKHFAACAKMVWDRLAPLSYFEKDRLSGGSGGVNIRLTIDNQASIQVSDDSPIDAEYADVESSDSD